jgi:uncharacterized protein
MQDEKEKDKPPNPEVFSLIPNENFYGLLPAAEKGNTHSQLYLFLCYGSGRGTKQNAAKAEHWLRRAADLKDPFARSLLDNGWKGADTPRALLAELERLTSPPLNNAVAHCQLGWVYDFGTHRRTAPAAARLLSRPPSGRRLPSLLHSVRFIAETLLLTAQSYAAALCACAVLLYAGIGVVRNMDKAFKHYTASAEQGFSSGINACGSCLFRGEGVAKDHVKAYEAYRRSADMGHPLAMTNVASSLECGEGIEKDHAGALACYERAAALDDSAALSALGWAHEHGALGIKKDIPKALTYFEKAGKMGFPSANYHAGVLLERGKDGVTKDLPAAVARYTQAADTGHAAAQASLGAAYEEGRGVTKDMKTALELYRKSAGSGFAHGQYFLAWCSRDGIGVERNVAEAVRLYKKAAAQKHGDSMWALGLLQWNGSADADPTAVPERKRTVEPDRKAAFDWICNAAGCGQARARDFVQFRYHTRRARPLCVLQTRTHTVTPSLSSNTLSLSLVPSPHSRSLTACYLLRV